MQGGVDFSTYSRIHLIRWNVESSGSLWPLGKESLLIALVMNNLQLKKRNHKSPIRCKTRGRFAVILKNGYNIQESCRYFNSLYSHLQETPIFISYISDCVLTTFINFQLQKFYCIPLCYIKIYIERIILIIIIDDDFSTSVRHRFIC